MLNQCNSKGQAHLATGEAPDLRDVEVLWHQNLRQIRFGFGLWNPEKCFPFSFPC